MASDRQLDEAWRYAYQLRRRVRWLIVALVVASTVAVIALVVAARSAGDRTTPPTEITEAEAVDTPYTESAPVPREAPAPAVPLDAAMHAAEQALPGRPEMAAYPHQATDARADRIARYRFLLAAGEPIVLAGDCHRTTTAFAARLSAEQREEWLRACLKVIEQWGSSTDWLKPLKERYGIWLYPVADDWPWSSLEAIYNLSADANTRLSAKAAWDALADEEHDRAVGYWETLRRTRNMINVGPRPMRRSLAAWP